MLKSWGLSADEAFAYQTLKIVKIKDYRLGGVYYGFLFLIICWVLGYQILYSNDHFQKLDVVGTAQLTIQQPTVGGCNPNSPACKSDFQSLTELPYCMEFQGNMTLPGKGSRRACRYADRHTLSPYGSLEEHMLVATRMDRTSERKVCNPSAANGYTCDNEYEIVDGADVTYVADIERSTVKISHSFGRQNIAGDSPSIAGSYMICPDILDPAVEDPRVRLPLESKRNCRGTRICKEIECITDSCLFLPPSQKPDTMAEGHFMQVSQERRGRRPGAVAAAQMGQLQPGLALDDIRGEGQPSTGPPTEPAEESKAARAQRLTREGIFAISEGDIFTVRKLLELAGVDLDKTLNKDGKPARESGTVIEIDVIYSNLHPWQSTFGNKHIIYYYDIRQRPVGEMKTELVSTGQYDREGFRTIENRHGILLAVKVSGTFGFFSAMYLLIMLTTALGLLAAASFLTDKLAIHYMQNDKYLKAMIDSTEELNQDADPQ